MDYVRGNKQTKNKPMVRSPILAPPSPTFQSVSLKHKHMYVYMYTNIYMYIFTQTYMYIFTQTYICIYVQKHICIIFFLENWNQNVDNVRQVSLKHKHIMHNFLFRMSVDMVRQVSLKHRSSLSLQKISIRMLTLSNTFAFLVMRNYFLSNT